MKRIIFDCDDVLANMRQSLAGLISEEHGAPVDWNDWIDFHGLGTQYDVDFEKVLELVILRDTLQTLDVEPFAKEAVEHFKNQGYHVYVLSARGFHPEGKNITEDWVIKHNLPVDDVIITDANKCKTDIIKSMGDIDIYIDDHPGHAINADALDNTKLVYLMNRPWNAKDKYHNRIDCLSELMKKHH